MECQDFEFNEEIDDNLKIFFLNEGGMKVCRLWETLLKEYIESPQQFKATAILYLVSISPLLQVSTLATPQVSHL